MKTARSSITNHHPGLELVHSSRKGMPYSRFSRIASQSPFTIQEWSIMLHLTLRTLQRYKKERLSFEPMVAERIMLLSQLNNLGREVFGNDEKFDAWLNAKIIALGGSKPKDLLDTAHGIELVRDELHRIEHGVLV